MMASTFFRFVFCLKGHCDRHSHCRLKTIQEIETPKAFIVSPEQRSATLDLFLSHHAVFPLVLPPKAPTQALPLI